MAEMYDRGFWSDSTLLDHYNETVRLKRDATCLADYQTELGRSHELSYGEFDQLATRLACGLHELGITKGDIVSFQLPNWWQFVVIHFACLKIGAISNPLMPIFRQRELSYMLEFAESKVLFVPKSFRGFDHEEMIEGIRAGLPKLKHVITIGGEDGAKNGAAGTVSDNMSFEHFMLENEWEKKHNTDELFAAGRLEPNDVMLILYTSGTTGMPKGVMHTSNTLLYGVREVNEYFGNEPGAVSFMGSPLAHLTGYLYGMMSPFYLRSKAVLLDVWNANKAWQLMDEHQAYYSMGATPFLADMTRSPEAERQIEKGTLKLFICGGAPIPRALAKEAAERLKVRLSPVWGMTETAVITAVGASDPSEKTTETDGRPVEGCDVKIVDPTSRIALPNGQDGLLLVRGPSLFVGYLKRPEAYDTNEDGWFDTGDIARMDDEGYIRITGRAKDIIIRGGENIPVVDVENTIYRHPGVEDAAVVGMPDLRLGELGVCYITLKEGAELSFNELQAFMEVEGLAKQYWPERLEIITDFPRTASGKIQKFKLREMATEMTE